MTVLSISRSRLASGVGVGLVTVATGLIGAMASHETFFRFAIAASVAVVFLAFGLRSPSLLLCALLVWLPALGMLRRLVSLIGPAGLLGDPLLLVATVAWILLAGMAVSRGALRRRTALATTVLALTGLITLSAVNPLQGGPNVGLGGLLLVVPPMLAFWVGRSLVDDIIMRRVITLISWLAIPAAAYGLLQTFVGFPRWDALWIAQDGYAALVVGDTIRAFSAFASAAEYADFLAIGLISWVSLASGARRLPLTVAAVGLLATALWFESSRGIIVLTLAALWLLFAVRRGLRLPWALLGGTALLVALPWLVGNVAPEYLAGNGSGGLSAHQAQGLSDPFGQQSTLPLHIDMMFGGFRDSIAHPLGSGVGAVTSAAEKFGGVSAGTETDPSNAAVAAGVLGLIAYIVLVLRGLPLAYRVAARRRDVLALAALGILGVTFLQWLNGAQYAVAPLPWLMLGWLDRQPGLDTSAPQIQVRP